MIDVSQFEPLLFLQRNWVTIALECSKIPINDFYTVHPHMAREDVAKHLINNKPMWVKGWDGVNNWLNWGIAINYQYSLGDAKLPNTSALLKQVYGLKFANISLFKGGTIIPMHTHPEMSREGLLTFHLGLDVPEECYLNVAGKSIAEENGKSIVFDGTLPHYSFNASKKDRFILYCEFSPYKLRLAN